MPPAQPSEPPRILQVAAIQMRCGEDSTINVARAEDFVRQAAGLGAKLILLPELFETPYFCKDQSPDLMLLARPLAGHTTIARMAALAAELGVVLPISFYELAGPARYNSLAMIDADGTVMGIYRKSHIPDGPGYQEKYYFNPGDTGFTPFATRVGAVGAAICWDQWFPESARTLALRGAEILLYPTAIGSEPLDPSYDSRDHWRRVMQGHAGANLMPLVAANRIGTEQGRSCAITFYGSSFIAGPQGELVAEAGRDEETILTAAFDLDAIARLRAGWGIFRDRRPELYRPIVTLDGGSGSS